MVNLEREVSKLDFSKKYLKCFLTLLSRLDSILTKFVTMATLLPLELKVITLS